MLKKTPRNVRIVHVGLAKCASTYLQKKILPDIARSNNLIYWSNTYKLKSLFIKNQIDIKMAKINEKLMKNDFSYNKSFSLKNEKNFILSSENLTNIFSDPYFYEKHCKLVKKIFGRNTHILIVLKKPSDLFKSIYLDLIQNGIIINYNDFFLKNKEYLKKNKIHKFNIEKFNYEYLINLFKKDFKKVSVIYLENNFLNQLKKEINYSISYSSEIFHKSISGSSLNFLIKFEKFLNNLNLSLYSYNKFIVEFTKNKFFHYSKINFFLNQLKLINLIKFFEKFLNKKSFKFSNRFKKENKIYFFDKKYKDYIKTKKFK